MSAILETMLLIGNWKAYVEDSAKAKALLRAAKRIASSRIEVVLAPPAPFIGLLAPKNGSQVAFAAQDISATSGGAATGEATAQIYVALGARYALIGHSERRKMGETDEQIAEKVAHAVAHGLTPVLCVGEKERDSESKYLSVVREQISSGLARISERERGNVIIAYEPVWAIGAKQAIDPSDLPEMVLYIRKVVAGLSTGKKNAKVLYGGSVDPDNIRALAGGSGVDGFLIGRASIESKSFAALAKALS